MGRKRKNGSRGGFGFGGASLFDNDPFFGSAFGKIGGFSGGSSFGKGFGFDDEP